MVVQMVIGFKILICLVSVLFVTLLVLIAQMPPTPVVLVVNKAII
jgi:hypothetical protein